MLSNLYTATGTYAAGSTNAMDYCALGSIDGAELASKNLTDPYLLGYIPPERMPGYLKIGHPVNDGKNFHVDYIEENHGFGFAINPGGDVYSANALSKTNTLVRGLNNYAIRMINTGFMACANYGLLDSDTITLYITAIAETNEYANDNKIFDSTDSGTKYQKFTLSPAIAISDLIDAIDNNTKITLTTSFDVLGKTRTFSFNDIDCNEYGLFRVNDSLNEIVIFFNITGFFGIPVNVPYVRDPDSVVDTLYIVPFFQSSFVEDPNSNLKTSCKIAVCSMNSLSYGSLRLSYDTTTELLGVTFSNFRIIDRYFIGNIPYNVNLNEIFSAYDGAYTPFTTLCAGIVGNKFIYTNLSNTQFDIFTTVKLSDIYNNFILMHKRKENTSQTYAEQRTYVGKAYVTLFDDENQPLYITENGEASDPDFMAKLQPWQYPNTQITINEFSPEDIPEYNPPTPGDNGENVGDNIARPATLGIGGTNGFVTQYALRATDIQELGEILWTSVFDSDYWQNYMFSLALDTGSFSMSSLLSFFVSLKVYPFALVNVPSYGQIGKNMYIGTGIHALEFTNNLHAINNYCDYIPGGECTVWSGYFFNDYRDYINATYTLYVPYCGTIELNPGDVVHSTLKVQYAVDFATGGCVAYVDVTTQDGAQFTIAALPGQMGADVPLTATAAGAVASRFIGDAMKFGGLISGEVSQVAGGIAAGMSGQNPGGGSGNVLSGMAGMVGGLPAAMGTDLAPGIAMQAANMIARGAVAAPMMSGGQGFASFGAPQTPYVQIRRGIYPDVTGLSTVCGKRGAGTYTIGDLSGFVQGDVKTDGLTCPENEKQKIRQLLAGGIYV